MLEALRRPAEFEAALRRAAEAGKPVVVRQGRHAARLGAERALAHSGAIAGSDAAFDALCRAYGAVRVRRLRRLDRGASRCSAPAAGRPARASSCITNSGGEGEHAADLAERAGIPLQPLPADLQQRSTPTGTSTAPRTRSTTTRSPSTS